MYVYKIHFTAQENTLFNAMYINKVGRIIQAISEWNLMGFSFVNTLMKS